METIIKLRLSEKSILDDSNVHFTTAESSISDAKTIEAGGTNDHRIATFEPNFWALDGSFHFQSDAIRCGYAASELTNPEGNYAAGAPYKAILVAFKSEHDITKITVAGSRTTGDFAVKLRVRYFGIDSNNQYFTKADITVYPESVSHTFTYPVEGVRGVQIIALTTSRPRRRARIMGIAFDDEIVLDGKSVTSANVLREISLSGAELPYGTINARFVSPDPRTFDITDTASVYNRLKHRLPIEVYYFDEETTRHIGRYYLSEWKSESVNVLSIEGVDLIGIMDEISYPGDFWQSDESFEIIVRRILSFVPDVKKITIAPGFNPPRLRGLLRKGTVRDALQQVLFAAGATVRVNGNEVIFDALPTLKSGVTPAEDFGRNKKALNGQELLAKPPVTRIELTTHNYQGSENFETIYEANLAVGEQAVEFAEPGLTPPDGSLVSGATLISTTPLIARIRVDNPGKVTIRGRKFSDTKGLIEIAGETVGKDNLIKIENAAMASPQSANGIIFQLQAFATKRFRQRFRAFAPKTLEAGEIVSVAVFNGRTLIGAVERLAIDLARSCITEYTVTGSIRDASANFTRAITIIGTAGTVTPGEFYYPSTSSQEFVAQVTAANADDYGITVTINGVPTVYPQVSAAFTLPTTDENTRVSVSFPVISRAIVVGGEGTVTPGRFRLSSKVAQYFTARVKPAHAQTRGIAVTIDGNTTVRGETERGFQLPTTTETTQVSVSFPDVTRAIQIATAAGIAVTVTPAKFRHSFAAKQSFTAEKALTAGSGAELQLYYLAVTINGATTVFDTNKKVFELENTTAATTVKVSAQAKPHKSIQISGYSDPWFGTSPVPSLFYYPVAKPQTVGFEAPLYDAGGGNLQRAKMDVRWFVNGILKSTQNGVGETSFKVSNTTAATTVRAEVSNISGEGGGGSGSGGGSGYTSWTGTITNLFGMNGAVLRDSPNNGGFLASLYAGDKAEVIGQQSGQNINGNALWYNVRVTQSVTTQAVGMVGWLWSGTVSGNNPNS